MVALIVPPFLARSISSEAFGVWAIILQAGALVGFLDFGLQIAVGRYLAGANEKQDSELQNRIVSTSVAYLIVTACVALIGAMVVALFLSTIFRQIPSALSADARWALLLVTGSFAIGLPASTFHGIFIGLQKSYISTVIIAGGRSLAALLVIWIAFRTHSVLQMAEGMALTNVLSAVAAWFAYRITAKSIVIAYRYVSKAVAIELIGFCRSLTLWAFAMLLISGLDLALVAYFSFKQVAFYSVAATLVSFLAGMQNALFTAMIPAAAVMQARGNAAALGKMMISATRYGMFMLLSIGLPLALFAKPVLQIWISEQYAEQAQLILRTLVVANIIRLSATPYVVSLIGTGEQRLVTISPMMEGAANLAASLIGGWLWGAVGVAFGTLFGAIIGVSGNFFYNMQRSKILVVDLRSYLINGLGRPILCSIPIAIYPLTLSHLRLSSNTPYALVLLSGVLIAVGILFWFFGLTGSERERIRAQVSILQGSLR